MTHADPWDAVVADLSGPPGEELARSPSAAGVPEAVVSGDHPFVARHDSIRCLKERSLPGRRLFAVAFSDVAGRPYRWLAGVEEREDGWAVMGGAGGGGHCPPQRDDPWVNLAGWWGPQGFFAGGDIYAADSIAAVRLTTHDGVVLEDDAEAGVVLFLTGRAIEVPVRLELLDGDGRAVVTQLELDY
jgi:hypothetical protein